MEVGAVRFDFCADGGGGWVADFVWLARQGEDLIWAGFKFMNSRPNPIEIYMGWPGIMHRWVLTRYPNRIRLRISTRIENFIGTLFIRILWCPWSVKNAFR